MQMMETESRLMKITKKRQMKFFRHVMRKTWRTGSDSHGGRKNQKENRYKFMDKLRDTTSSFRGSLETKQSGSPWLMKQPGKVLKNGESTHKHRVLRKCTGQIPLGAQIYSQKHNMCITCIKNMVC